MRRKNLILALTLSWTISGAAPAPGQGQVWLINEVETGSGMVELINASSSPADPSGLCLWANEQHGNSCSLLGLPPFLHLQVPAGTAPVLPGGTLVFESRPAPAYPCGLAMTRATSWGRRSELIIWINRDPNDWSRQILDMVSFGDTNTVRHVRQVFQPGGSQWTGGPVMRPGRGNCIAVYRTRDPVTGSPVDTDTAGDWQVVPSGLQSPCAPNPAGTPNPMTIGQGFSISGNCAPQAFANTTTELPTLTLADCSFNPRPGGSIQFAIRSGMNSAPPLTCLLFGQTVPTGVPLAIAGCGNSLVSYLDPSTAGSTCLTALPWDAHFAADLPVLGIPSSSGLIGLEVGFQVYLFDPAAGSCPLRNTNGMRIRVKP